MASNLRKLLQMIGLTASNFYFSNFYVAELMNLMKLVGIKFLHYNRCKIQVSVVYLSASLLFTVVVCVDVFHWPSVLSFCLHIHVTWRYWSKSYRYIYSTVKTITWILSYSCCSLFGQTQSDYFINIVLLIWNKLRGVHCRSYVSWDVPWIAKARRCALLTLCSTYFTLLSLLPWSNYSCCYFNYCFAE